MYGKTLKTAVARVHNSGSVSGNITARAQQLKRPLNKNSYTPQFYDISLITSGNGVSMANYIETPDKYTYSQEKQNHVHLGSLDNSGSLRGQATLEGGTRTTHTYTASKGSGNGVSLFASTGRFAKNAIRVALDNVNNDGHISGQIRQISGNNSGYNSPHMMSGSEATGSGNGISVYQATGNPSLTALENINNEGIIQGHIETRAGTVYSSAQRGQTIPEKRARLVVSDGKTIADYYKPNPTPEKPASAGDDNYGTFANFHADSDVRASGNGISVQYASGVGADVNSGASLGDITNSGVISGYAENYHGYARGYGRVSTLNSGAGIATDRKITSNITNRGIISGNHAAILAKGRVNDSQSIREPNLEPGYEPGKIQNYGLMAGSMIAGSYRAGVGNLDLGAGDDTLTIADNSVRINGQRLNLGAGNDTVHLGQPGRRARAGGEPITVHYTLEGAENLSVNQASRFTAGAKVRTNTITLNQADLTYQIDNNDQHALYDATRTSDVTLRGNGKLLIDTYKDDKAEREISIGGSGKLLSEGGVQTASTNHMQTATLADGKIKIAPRVAVQPGQSVNAQPNSAATTNTAANHTTAISTVGSLVRLNRDNDAASATFETSYADAYNSYTSAWRNTGNNPLKNSSYLPETAQAEKAVNQYLADTVAHNPYGAVPAATLAAHQDTRRELLDNHARPLRQGETYAAISGSLARNDALKTSDSKAHDNQLGIGISHGITNDLTLGITASVGREKINGSYDSHLKGNSHYIGAHAVKTLGDLSLTGGLAYSQTSLKGTRHITNGYDAQSHAARNKPSVTSAYAEGKYTLRLNDHLAWEPKAILAYNHLKTSSVNENGSGGLTIASRGINTVDIGIGQDLTYSTKAGSGEIRGKLSLDYIHTSGEKDLQARFNGSDSTFTLRTDKNPNTVRAGLSGEYQTASGVIIRAGVSDNLRKGKNDLQGTLSVGVKF